MEINAWVVLRAFFDLRLFIERLVAFSLEILIRVLLTILSLRLMVFFALFQLLLSLFVDAGHVVRREEVRELLH